MRTIALVAALVMLTFAPPVPAQLVPSLPQLPPAVLPPAISLPAIPTPVIPPPPISVSSHIDIQLGTAPPAQPVLPAAPVLPSSPALPSTPALPAAPSSPRMDQPVAQPVSALPGSGASPGQALITLPALPGSPQMDALLGVNAVTALPGRAVQALTQDRRKRAAALVRSYPDQIALDPNGFPARAHEVVVSDPADALIAAAKANGFRLIEQVAVLGSGYARFRAPDSMTLKAAMRALQRLGAREVTADQLHFPSGVMTSVAAAAAPPARNSATVSVPFPRNSATVSVPSPRNSATTVVVGMIDAGVAGTGLVQRGFATGAPRPSDHGTAIASLIAGRGMIKGGAPGARVIAADVYGSDPAGGSATAIVKALGWLAEQKVPVVTISLVGPENPLLGRVVAAAQRNGMILVAAVGNDGPAAPFSYPASYPGVIAVTAVDGRNRILIEAGRARNLDYAAPGADMLAADARGGAVAVRGTSFAAPLAAARIASFYGMSNRPADRRSALAQVDKEAQRLGKPFGRGLVCGACRTPVK